MRKYILILLSIIALQLNAQTTINAKLEPSTIKIGEQAILKFEIAQQKGANIAIPVLKDTVVAGVDVVKILKADTIDLGNNRIAINANYIVSSYDSGFYYIPALKFADNNQIIETKPLGLTVATVQVNEQTDDIRNIKAIMDAPFSWTEVFKWTSIVLSILLGIALIVFVLVKYVFKKKIKIIPEKPKVIIPAHIIAFESLEQIKTNKVWQTGEIKTFYTQVSDVLRVYLVNRFNIDATEMTTDEILSVIKKNKDIEGVKLVLKQILELSDLVKFAKFVPLEDENLAIITKAYQVVDQTKNQETTNTQATV